jgi:hypothetical protein
LDITVALRLVAVTIAKTPAAPKKVDEWREASVFDQVGAKRFHLVKSISKGQGLVKSTPKPTTTRRGSPSAETAT